VKYVIARMKIKKRPPRPAATPPLQSLSRFFGRESCRTTAPVLQRVITHKAAETEFDPLGLRPLPLAWGRTTASVGFRGCVEHGARSEQLPAWKGGVSRRDGVVFFIRFSIKIKYAATCWAMPLQRRGVPVTQCRDGGVRLPCFARNDGMKNSSKIIIQIS